MIDLSFLKLSLICGCPETTAIPTIPSDDCIERLGQIQRYGIQRLKNGAVLNEIVIGTSDPTLQATWTTLTSAVDATKVQFAPFVHNPENEPGEAREYGGGNQTVGGVPIILGSSNSPFNGEHLDVKQTIIKEMKKFRCGKFLSVFLLNERGQIIGLTDDPDSPTTFRGIPIYSYFVSDKKMGMYEEPDKNFVSWSFVEDWSDNIHIVTPAFDALALL